MLVPRLVHALTLALLPLGQPAAAAEEVPTTIDWQLGSYINAQGKARHEARSLCLYFWADGSAHCQALYQGALSQPEVAAALGTYVCYSADVGRSGRSLLQRYQVSVLPTVLFTDSDGAPLDAIVGSVATQEFLSQLTRIQSGRGTVPALRAQVAAAPDDLNVRLQLALKLDHVGYVDESRAAIAAIRAEDPNGKTLVGARLAFWELRDGLQAELDAAPDPAAVDLGPLRRHLADVRHDAVKFEAWQWIGGIEADRGARGPAREALAAAWDVVPAPQRMEWAYALVSTYFDQRDELERREKRLVLEVAKDLDALADTYDTEREAAKDRGEELDEVDFPPRVMAHTALACGHFLAGKRGDARREAKAAIELAPEDGELKRLLEPILAR